MNRFRFTLLAVCLVLLYLGMTDLSLFFRNQAPAPLSISDLEQQGPPREWLQVTGGYQDLEQAISTSGSIELNALLVPLKASPEQKGFRVLVETRNPRVMELFKTYHFKFDSVFAKEKYLAEHREEFYAQRDITGMEISGLIASGNRDKLLELAQELGMEVDEDVVFLAEGKEPASWRGFLFVALAIAGLIKFATMLRKAPAAHSPESDAEPTA